MSKEKAGNVNISSSRIDADEVGSVVSFDMPSCGGCCTCELACSFHHTGEFSTMGSSIKILDKEGEEGCQVQLVAQTDGESNPCDGCRDLDVPLCMEYCRESDDLGRMLQAFEEKKR